MGEQRNLTAANVEELRAQLKGMKQDNPDLQYRFLPQEEKEMLQVHPTNEKLMEKWAVKRWLRQMETPYPELSEEEKESDRKEADKFLALIKASQQPVSADQKTQCPRCGIGEPMNHKCLNCEWEFV